MIEFRTYFTGSSGNFHTVKDGNTTIALDFGVPFREAQRALNFKLAGDIAGALITHQHL